jgi:hypothetical protein
MNKLETIKEEYIQTAVAVPITENLSYLNLRQFRDMLADESEMYQPYTIRKQSLWGYRIIFALMGFTLMSLGYLAFTSMPYSLVQHYFEQFRAIKILIAGFSFALGFISLLFSLSFKAEKEALKHSFHHARKELYREYRKKVSKLNFFGRFLPFGNVYQQHFHYKDSYLKARHRMEEERHKTAILLKKISSTQLVVSKAKETLFNEALVEFEFILKNIVKGYEST